MDAVALRASELVWMALTRGSTAAARVGASTLSPLSPSSASKLASKDVTMSSSCWKASVSCRIDAGFSFACRHASSVGNSGVLDAVGGPPHHWSARALRVCMALRACRVAFLRIIDPLTRCSPAAHLVGGHQIPARLGRNPEQPVAAALELLLELAAGELPAACQGFGEAGVAAQQPVDQGGVESQQLAKAETQQQRGGPQQHLLDAHLPHISFRSENLSAVSQHGARLSAREQYTCLLNAPERRTKLSHRP